MPCHTGLLDRNSPRRLHDPRLYGVLSAFQAVAAGENPCSGNDQNVCILAEPVRARCNRGGQFYNSNGRVIQDLVSGGFANGDIPYTAVRINGNLDDKFAGQVLAARGIRVIEFADAPNLGDPVTHIAGVFDLLGAGRYDLASRLL